MYILNYGPHHPSTHGVLRLLFTMEGEEIINCEPIIGYLHRGVEKLIESKKFISIIPYIDRLDYLAPVMSEHAYALALEKVLNIEVPRRALIIRTIFDELTRIACHIMGIGCATYDIGLMNVFLYGMEEREKIMDIFYSTTSNRMHLAYYIPGGVTNDINNDIINSIILFINNLDFYLNTVEKLALNNRIFKQRTENIGIISKELAIKYGISGVNLRATGINYDTRKIKPYGIYNELNFKPIILNKSDCYNRTYLRYLEIKQSIDLIKQCLELIKDIRQYYDRENSENGNIYNDCFKLKNIKNCIYKEEYNKHYGLEFKDDENKKQNNIDEKYIFNNNNTLQKNMEDKKCYYNISKASNNIDIINNDEYCSYNKYKRQDGSYFFYFNIKLPANTTVYSSVENSRGEFGIHLFTGNKPSTTPHRIHFKSPSFAIIQMLKDLLKGVILADVSVILGSLDFIMGDCDR